MRTFGIIILGIVMFMFLVVIHELGHYFAAKKSGVFVKEFGIGIPPKAFSFGKDKSGTERTLNWIPLGGFVRLQGEDPSDPEEFLHPESLISASLPKKIIILLGGVIVNAVFALIAFTVAFWIGVKPITIIPDSALRDVSVSYLVPSYSFLEDQGLVPEVDYDAMPATVAELLPESLAVQAGVQVGDTIASIDGVPISASSLGEVLSTKGGGSIEIVIDRGGEQRTQRVDCQDEGCVLGVGLAGTQMELPTIQFSGIEAVGAAWHECRAQVDLTFSALGRLGRSFLSFDGGKIKESVNGLSGPVGIVKVGGDILDSGGWVLYLAFAGMISLALAIFNILPIPALDGGRIVGVLTQAIGRFSPQSYFIIENYINFFFFVALMILGVYIIFKDLDQIWSIPIPFIG